MRINRRSLILVLLCTSTLQSSCTSPPTGLSDEPAEDIVMYGVGHNITLDGRLLANVQADSLYYREGSQAALLWHPTVDFSPLYPDNPPVLSSDQLVHHFGRRRLTLRGNAVFEFPASGFRVTGEEIGLGYSEGWLVADSPSMAFPLTRHPEHESPR
jgi:hypothetical protein